MMVAIIAKINKLAYKEDISKEQALKNTEEMLESIKKEKEDGILLDVFGMPGEDSTMWIYNFDSLDTLEEFFMTDDDKYMTYELHYLTDFEKIMKKKLEKGIV